MRMWLNTGDRDDNTPLHLACQNGHAEMASYLLQVRRAEMASYLLQVRHAETASYLLQVRHAGMASYLLQVRLPDGYLLEVR